MDSWPLDSEEGDTTISWNQSGRKLVFIWCTRQHTQMPEVLVTERRHACPHLCHFHGKDHQWVKFFFRKVHLPWRWPEISNATYIQERLPRWTVSMCCVQLQEAPWGPAEKQMKWWCKHPTMSVKAGETRKSTPFPCPTGLQCQAVHACCAHSRTCCAHSTYGISTVLSHGKTSPLH